MSDALAPAAHDSMPTTTPAAASASVDAPQTTPPPPRTKRRRRLGIASFVLALLTVLFPVAAFLVIWFGFPAAVDTLDQLETTTGLPFMLGGWGVMWGMGAGIFVIAMIVSLCAFVTCGLSILLGILGFALRSGRVLSAIGILLSVAFLAANIVFLVWMLGG